MDYKQTNTAAIWLSVLAALLLGSSIYYWNKSGNLIKEKNKTELKADSLLSVKFDLERNIKQISNDLNAQLAEATTQNDQLEERVESVQNKLRSKDNLLSKIRHQNATSVSQLNTQIAQLEGVRTALQAELTQAKDQNQQSLADNTNLKNNTTALEGKINALGTELAAMKALVTVDNFRVDVRKPNDKLTAKAKKTKNLQISFTLPALWKIDGNETICLSISDLKNNPVDGTMRTETIKVGGSALQIPVHAVKTVDFSNNPQQVTIDYEPARKVEPGFYIVKAYTKDSYLGSTEFGLRNSFWFF
ncbi:hypothetical protein GO730_34690 [Spirosoma sp. HMF3257]|uniref:Uncharacterized protein n=1 Tax=Spirosoma telluris TaxID=2183553 RepID=A0A327NRS3_9BACT|nr:hypothetical protein [Spirosoma telluris]RAI77947.1 hypothetical protein HMF3257_34585 [Spirosoma telluris]